MRVLVCGGRDYTDRAKVWRVLDALKAQVKKEGDTIILIEGKCRTGADKHAGDWAVCNLPVQQHLQFPADWTTYGNSAGPIRNRQMLEQGKPDLVIAFGGRNGTDHMVAISKAKNPPPMIVEFDRCDEA